MTASECTFTPQSHSSAYETASEGGLMSPWWASSGTDKNSFETCSSSDMDSEVPSMQLLSGVISSATTSFDDSEHSFLSTIQSPFMCSDDDVHAKSELDDMEFDRRTLFDRDVESVFGLDDDPENAAESLKIVDDNGNILADRSSWDLVTKHTVKGCL